MRRNNYVCGYLGEKQCIYGKNFRGELKDRNWIDPMTLFQAKKYADKVNKQWRQSGKESMQVFKLTLVK